jgi:proline dehydrogenase
VIRWLLLYLSQARWAQATVSRWRFARRAAHRFVAGETLTEAIAVARRLAEHGLTASLAHLGEEITDPAQASQATADLIELVRAVAQADLRASVSLKLTQIGLLIDFDQCQHNMLSIAREAAVQGVFLRIDMEHSDTIDQALSVHYSLLSQQLEQVGLVFQSALFRSQRDLQTAASNGTRVRLVKGAYLESETVAYQKKAEVDANFDRLTELLLTAARDQGSMPASSDGRTSPLSAVASHDQRRIDHAEQFAQRIGLPKQALEFQLLLGIRSELQRSLQSRGYPVRVYVPFGTQWYPYLVRRLAERPANLWFFLSNLFRK